MKIKPEESQIANKFGTNQLFFTMRDGHERQMLD